MAALMRVWGSVTQQHWRRRLLVLVNFVKRSKALNQRRVRVVVRRVQGIHDKRAQVLDMQLPATGTPTRAFPCEEHSVQGSVQCAYVAPCKATHLDKAALQVLGVAKRGGEVVRSELELARDRVAGESEQRPQRRERNLWKQCMAVAVAETTVTNVALDAGQPRSRVGGGAHLKEQQQVDHGGWCRRVEAEAASSRGAPASAS